jgi:hypothetical protein
LGGGGEQKLFTAYKCEVSSSLWNLPWQSSKNKSSKKKLKKLFDETNNK